MEEEFYHGMPRDVRDALAVGYMLAAFYDMGLLLDKGLTEDVGRIVRRIPEDIRELYGITLEGYE